MSTLETIIAREPKALSRDRSWGRLGTLAAFAGLLGLSLALRLFGVGWGVPSYDLELLQHSLARQSYHMDEDNFLWALALMEPAKGSFDIKDYHWGSLQHYLIYGALLAGSALGFVPAPWEEAFLGGDAAALPRLYILGRLVSVAAGAATTALVAAMAAILAGRAAGMAAALAYALAPLAVMEAHYLTNDVTMSAFLTGSLLAAVVAVRRENRKGEGQTVAGVGSARANSSLQGSAAAGTGAPHPGPLPFWEREKRGQLRPGSGSAAVATTATGAGTRERSGPVDEARWRWLAVAGLLFGLAVAAKYSALFAAPGVGLAQLAAWRALGTERGARDDAPGSSRRRAALLVFALPWAAAVAGFLAGEPYALLAPGSVLESLRYTANGNLADPASGLGPMLGILGWQAVNLAGLALTWPLACLAMAGVALLAGRLFGWMRGYPRVAQLVGGVGAPAAAVILGAIAGLVFSLALNRVPMLRYTQPLLPLLAVAAGVAWAAVPGAVLRGLLGVPAAAVAAVMTLGQLSVLAGPHPADELSAWMKAHLQPGQAVARLWPEHLSLDERRYRLIRIEPWAPDLPPGERPDYVVMDDMRLGPVQPGLASLLARDYVPVATFQARPHIGPFAWSQGETPHDWKYSHPTLVVYARR